MRNNLENVVKGIKRFAGATILAASLAFAVGCSGVGSSKPSVPDYSAEKTAITNGANRIVQLQDSNGGWDWDVTNASGPTGTDYLNIEGVTADGLLAAYKVTGDKTYLDDAIKAGDYLVSGYGNNGANAGMFGQTGKVNINAFNVKFLYNLGKITGNTAYTDEATALMDIVMNYSPTQLGLDDLAYRGNDKGLAAWDLFNYVPDAKSASNSAWATSLASLANDPSISLSFSDPCYIVGLSALSMGGNAKALQTLKSLQRSDGTWTDPNGTVQDTAYAVMALIKAGDMTDAYKGVKAGMDKQAKSGVNSGGWVDQSTSPQETAESDSEVVQAISHYIGE